MIKIAFICSILITVIGCSSNKQTPKDPLAFDKTHFETFTIHVTTSEGVKEVTYKAYMHLPYVANPVDTCYQSLNVFEPVQIQDKKIDASNAPVFFVIGVGGYMSVNNANSIADLNPEKDRSSEGRRFRGMNASDPNTLLALANGYVVVAPGCRGRDNQSADGVYYGKAPAAIVDLKAAVRYIRHNKGLMPGNTEWIVSRGCSAGGALSTLLGASGNSKLYEPYLQEIGAANEKDNILAAAAFSPIADLEHADAAYEWNFGETPNQEGLVDQTLSQQLKTDFSVYQQSLHLMGKKGFGELNAENYANYLLQYFIQPSATSYLSHLSEEERKKYLAENSWINWNGQQTTFSFKDYVAHVGRMKGLPAFDDFNKKQPEPQLFGNDTINARHFTNFSLRHATGDETAEISTDITKLTHLMNPMYFILHKNEDAAPHWWIRNGSSDPHTSQSVAINIATGLENMHRDVNTWLFWDGGHCADNDAEGLMAWIANITKYHYN